MSHGPEQRELIAAIATPAGTGGVGIIRISGRGAKQLGEKFTNKNLEPRIASYSDFRCRGDLIDSGIALFFKGPNSFTGEDIVELHGHGGPIVMNTLLRAVCSEGARVAKPGEFSERAFLNEKIDLVQAEAISDLINSASEKAAKAAIKTISGEFSFEVEKITSSINRLRIFVEANLDFPDEEIDELDLDVIRADLKNLNRDIEILEGKTNQGVMLASGLTVALLGAPNVGKSSIFNALAEKEEAIVTEVPGTTRDLLKVNLTIAGLSLRLIDTAGIRRSDDQVEKIGIEKTLSMSKAADLVIEVRDLTADHGKGVFADYHDIKNEDKLVVFNKSDLVEDLQSLQLADGILVSALTGAGMETLRQAILDKVGFKNDEVSFTARIRHIESMRMASNILKEAQNILVNIDTLDLLADHLRQAQEELAEILGTLSPDELLGKIFTEFCIGK